jgi:hypothetical protein
LPIQLAVGVHPEERSASTPHTSLLETRLNEVMAFAYRLDSPISKAEVNLSKVRMGCGAVGVERQSTRAEFFDQLDLRQPSRIIACAGNKE